MAMLQNPKAWTHMETSYHGYWGHDIELANRRVKITAHRDEEKVEKSGALWFKKTEVHPEQFSASYVVFGPSKQRIQQGTLNGKEVFNLAQDILSRSAIHSIQGASWPSGEPCSYCGTPLTDGRCSTCGAAKTAQKPAIA